MYKEFLYIILYIFFVLYVCIYIYIYIYICFILFIYIYRFFVFYIYIYILKIPILMSALWRVSTVAVGGNLLS